MATATQDTTTKSDNNGQLAQVGSTPKKKQESNLDVHLRKYGMDFDILDIDVVWIDNKKHSRCGLVF